MVVEVVIDPRLKEHSLVPKGASPEVCSVCFGDAEVVSLEESVREDGLQLGQHVTEDQRQLGQVASEEQERKEQQVSTGAGEGTRLRGYVATHPKTSIWTLEHALAKTSLEKDRKKVKHTDFILSPITEILDFL